MAVTTLAPRAVNLKQAAVIADLSENKMRDLVRQGVVKSIRVGRRHVISLREIDRFLDGASLANPSDPRP
jgi:hypothetical protein